MRSVLIPGLLIGVLGATAAFAAPAVVDGNLPTHNRVSVSALQLTLNLHLINRLPDGTAVLCKARINPNGQGLKLLETIPAVPAGAATGRGTVIASSANCTVEIPFSWATSQPVGAVSLRYEVEALGASTASAATGTSRTQGEIGTVVPSDGTRARLNVSLAF